MKNISSRAFGPLLLSRLSLVAALAGTSVPALAQARLPPPDATDPVTLGTMVGSPPAPDKRVSLANVLAYPNGRWAFHHLRELGPTINIWRGNAPLLALPETPVNLDEVNFDAPNGQRMNVAEWQKAGYTDALLVLHRGRVVYEHYYAGMRAEDRHVLWSGSKSIVGLLATMLIHDGTLDAQAPITRYVPELADSAWGDATVQQTLDMTTGVAYTENFVDPGSSIHAYLRSAGLVPAAPDYAGPRTVYEYLKTLKKQGEHGVAFRYKSVDTEVMAWVLRRASGRTLADLASRRLWSQIGMEEDAFAWLDPIGTEVGSVGLSAGLRDLGRLGEVLRTGGRVAGRLVVPEAVIKELRFGGDPRKFAAGAPSARAGYAYHNYWWIPNDRDQTFEAKGLNGQQLHVNPAAEVVIVKLSSHPVPDTAFTHQVDRKAFEAIAKALRQ